MSASAQAHNPGAHETARAVRAREVDPAAAVEDALASIATHSGALNALCLALPAAARARAQELRERIERGQDPGPLAGVPVTIKDGIWQRGIVASDGSRSRADVVPDESAAPVERLEAAGAVIVGRTNVPEFCYRGVCHNDLYGISRNPWDIGRTTGGSSGGAAAAVASGMCAIALGSDGGGSIRIPASFCGVAGIKPTFGVVPREPQWPGWLTLTHVGPLAFGVADCALALDTLAGVDARDPASVPSAGGYLEAAIAPDGLRGLRIAASADLGYVRLDDEVREAFASAVERLRALGAIVEWAHPAVESPLEIWNGIACADNWAGEGPLLEGGRVGDDARGLIEAGAAGDGRGYADARNAARDYAIAWGRFMERYDLVVTPTMELPAFAAGQWAPAQIGGVELDSFYDDYCHFCYPFNLTGQPAMSVPMPGAGSLPLGLQIVGRRFEDARVLRAAAEWERAVPWGRPEIPAAAASAPPDLLAAVERGERAARIEGVEAMDDGHLRAGVLVDAGGRRVVLTRAWSLTPGTLELEWEPA